MEPVSPYVSKLQHIILLIYIEKAIIYSLLMEYYLIIGHREEV